MDVAREESLPLRSSADIVKVRQTVRQVAVDCGLGLVDQTKLVTAASELARNAVEHGGGGTVQVDVVRRGSRRGVRVTVQDKGPGIADVQQALRDGYSTGTGLGLGLGGARRLVNEFEIASRPGEGTRVSIVRWT